MTEAALDLVEGTEESDPGENLDILADGAEVEADGSEDEETQEEETSQSFEDWEKDQAKESENSESEAEKETDKPEEKAEDDHIEVKVDGEVLKIEREKIPALIQKGIGAERRMQEAHNIRTEAKEFVQYMKENPWQALERLGLDVDDLSEKRVYDKVMYERMSPEEKQAHDTRTKLETSQSELKRYKKEEEARENKAKEEQQAKAREDKKNEYLSQYKQQIPKALDLANIPKTEENIRSVVIHMREALRENPSATAYDVIEAVRSEHLAKTEAGRKQRVDDYNDKPASWQEQAPRVAKVSASRSKPKRMTSIYDLMD